jgi:hypothetical protein
VEFAEKRAIARAAKLAFGQDVPDEADIERQVTEETERRKDPVLVKELSDKYDRIYGTDGSKQFELPPERSEETEAAVATDVESEAPAEPSSQEAGQAEVTDTSAWSRHRELASEAAGLHIRVKTLRTSTPLEEVDAYNRDLEDRIATETERRRSIARQNLAS